MIGKNENGQTGSSVLRLGSVDNITYYGNSKTANTIYIFFWCARYRLPTVSNDLVKHYVL